MPITDEELKAIFHANDYTTYVPKYDKSKATEAENKTHSRAKEMFYKSWCGQLLAMGGKSSLKNFSKDYPAKLLEQTDENIVAERVVKVIGNEEQLQAVFEFFFSAMEKPFEDALCEQAAELGKSVDDLTDDELMVSVDKVADSLMNFMIGKMMVSQSVPEILQITKENGTHEDFNRNNLNNHDRIDFERKWDHLRTKLGKMLSIEEFDPDDEALACWDEDSTEERDFVSLTARFIGTLDNETDRNIVMLKLQKKTQSEIAKALDFSSQGTVAKRLKKIREQLEAFIKSNM